MMIIIWQEQGISKLSYRNENNKYKNEIIYKKYGMWSLQIHSKIRAG
jgi:hypothetical protein